MKELQDLAAKLNIRLTTGSHETYNFEGEVTEADINAAQLEWQSPTKPDCGCGDGCLYVMYEDLYVCIDPNDHTICAC